MYTDLLYQIALSDIPNIGHIHAKILCEHFGTAQAIFRASCTALERIEGIGEIRARNIKSFNNFYKAEKEIAFIKKYGIKPLFFLDKDYPQRLLNCYDPPILLFYKGNVDLNASKIISIVGTRRNSEYGKTTTEKLIKDLSTYGVLIVSGLAFGIDAIAHKSALKNGMDTIGVIGHGLDIIYPPENMDLAKEMVKQGGLLTEFRSKTKPDKHNFPSRNRIVAGISDATIIIETDIKGGSMITANTAFDYNRDVFAIPGRLSDPRSRGCHLLIRENKATLLEDAKQLAELLGWKENARRKTSQQTEMFVELDENEKTLTELIGRREKISLEELNILSGFSASSLVTTLLKLELKNIIQSLPGKTYRVAL